MRWTWTRKKNNGVRVSPFSCQRDGLTLRGYEYRGAGDNLPIAIVSHGFMANQGTLKHYAKLLADLGYCAFTFDFSGGCVMMGKSDGRTTDMSVLTEVADLNAVIDYAVRLTYVDKGNILLMGCSQGGFVSALTAAKLEKDKEQSKGQSREQKSGEQSKDQNSKNQSRKDQIKSLVMFYPALCIPDDARAGKMMFARFDPHNLPEQIRCGPMKLGRCYAADVLEMDPFEEIKGFTGDVLLVHGTKDKIVNLSYAQKAVSSYPPEKLTFRIIDGGGHGFSKKHDAIAMDELKKFIGEK